MRPWMSSWMLVLVLAATAWAQSDENFTKEPGYVDFSRFAAFQSGKEVVEVYLTQPLLSVARWAVMDDDPELAEMLSKLHLLRVNVFSFDPSRKGKLGGEIEGITSELTRSGWTRVVKIRDEEGDWNILVKMDEKGGTDGAPAMNGLVLVGIGGKDSEIRYQNGDDLEAIFVNVVGTLDFAQLSKLGEHFDIPGLESLEGTKTAPPAPDKPSGGE